MDRILRIDMGTEGGPKITEEPLGEYAGLAGRALTSAIVSREVPPLCHPLGGYNKLVMAPGMLSGTAVTMSGRLSFGTKSPLTGGIKEANAGGQGAEMLARLGYAAIVLEGKPKRDDLYRIHINKDGARVILDNSLKLLANYDLVDRMKYQYGKKIACISIGQAGEMKMCAATVAVTDMELRPTRHARRGGVGAVMGVKRVKSIVLDDSGVKLRCPMDPEKFMEANKRLVEVLRKHPVAGEGLPNYGTNVLPNSLCDETVWAHGVNWGISDLDAIALLDFLSENYGLDNIEMGVTIGVAMEAGLLKFGDAEAAINLLKEVGQGTHLGRIIGSGAAVTGRIYGVERVPVVKGQALPAYDPRVLQGIGVTFATSPMGADHTAGYPVTANILRVGGFMQPEGQVQLSRDLQIATAALDSTGMGLSIAFVLLDRPETFHALLDLLNAFYGTNLTADDVGALGKKVLTMERDFNACAGFSAQHDRLPEFFKK